MRVGRTLLALVLAIGLGAGTLVACGDDDDGDGAPVSEDGSSGESDDSTAAPLPIGEVQTFEVAARNHVDHVVDYPQTPPVGGDHARVWQDCGFYDAPIFNEAAVHSLEHGAVWITFRPSLPADQVDQIASLANEPYTLASPWEDDSLGAPIVLSAWGAQLAIEALPSPEADEFLATYREADTAPEPGAPCSNGFSETR